MIFFLSLLKYKKDQSSSLNSKDGRQEEHEEGAEKGQVSGPHDKRLAMEEL